MPIGQANANLAELAAGLNGFLLGGAADGRLVFSFDNLGLAGLIINAFSKLKLLISNQKEHFHSPLRNILYLCVLSE